MLSDRLMFNKLLLLILLFVPGTSGGVEPGQCAVAMKHEAREKYELLKKLADEGDHCAQRSLARAYFEGKIDGKRQTERALKYAKRAADAGLDLAQYELALMYMTGVYTDVDGQEIVNWLESAAKQGYVPAQTTLGTTLIDGRLVKKDLFRGFQWLLEAYRNGSAVAEQLLNEMADAISTKK